MEILREKALETRLNPVNTYTWRVFIPWGGGGAAHVNGGGMLVVSHRGVNFRFWYRLGCSEQNTIIFSRKGLI